MNEQNWDFLSRQIKFTGFGEGHDQVLKEKMETGIAEFVLIHGQQFGRDDATATLHFRKSETLDLYFFNRFDLVVNDVQQTSPLSQTFYIHPKEDHISFKEGYNLLKGRPVYKEYKPREGEKYKAWLQLDFKEKDKNGQYKIVQFHPNYGFDLEATIHKHPIQELNTVEGIKRLLESLERGNRQMVTYGEPGHEQRVFIEASPQFKSINIYDDSMRRIRSVGMQKKQVAAESTISILPETTVSPSPAKKEFQETPQTQKANEIPKKSKRQKMPR
jgi:hypothetical protein